MLRKYVCIGCLGVILVLSTLYFHQLPDKNQPHASSILNSLVIVSSNTKHSSSISIEVINSLERAVDLRDLTVAFDSPEPVSQLWGSFPSVSFPGAIEVKSIQLPDKNYRVLATLRFAELDVARTSLFEGDGFFLDFDLPQQLDKNAVSNVTVLPYFEA